MENVVCAVPGKEKRGKKSINLSKEEKEYMTLQIIVDCTTNRFQLVHVYK